jgi:uncharacterized membrane protein SpoIIM required for sporulation
MSMTRQELVRARHDAWDRLRRLLAARTQGALSKPAPAEIREISELYRSLAGDLMRVRRDKLGADLERQLDDLASRAHNLIYAQTSVGNRLRPLDLLADFPGAVRRNAAFVGLAFMLFYLPGGLAGGAAYVDESYALAVMSAGQLEAYEEMYRHPPSDQRNSNVNSAMTGFYINHNIGIALSCFATGILFGLGSLYFLLTNGIDIGVTFGHLARVGYGENIFSFVAAHSPWELTAIVLAGAAGFQMGFALVKTGGRTRVGNLQAHVPELLRQVAGIAVLLSIAALIEGWFSPSGAPVELKYAMSALGAAAVTALLVFVGRDRAVPEDVLLLRGAEREAEATP